MSEHRTQALWVGVAAILGVLITWSGLNDWRPFRSSENPAAASSQAARQNSSLGAAPAPAPTQPELGTRDPSDNAPQSASSIMNTEASSPMRYEGDVRVDGGAKDLDSLGQGGNASGPDLQPEVDASDLYLAAVYTRGARLATWRGAVNPTETECADLLQAQGTGKDSTAKIGTTYCVWTSDGRVADVRVKSVSSASAAEPYVIAHVILWEAIHQ